MPSAGIEPAFQASEACVLSVALRGLSKFNNEINYMLEHVSLQGERTF